jgi:hypothetical protein
VELSRNIKNIGGRIDFLVVFDGGAGTKKNRGNICRSLGLEITNGHIRETSQATRQAEGVVEQENRSFASGRGPARSGSG